MKHLPARSFVDNSAGTGGVSEEPGNCVMVDEDGSLRPPESRPAERPLRRFSSIGFGGRPIVHRPCLFPYMA
jgi:hypothetical protein